MHRSSPVNQAELLTRAEGMAGLTVGELASQLHWQVPQNLRHNKGWIGQLIEAYLGAPAGSSPEPDFPTLNIELKTIPVGEQGEPQETTFVCAAQWQEWHRLTWETSPVRRKLQRVLWVPIQADAQSLVMQRRIGMPLLWELPQRQEIILRRDWEELTDLIAMGQIEKIHASLGVYLQIRPKAAHSRVLCEVIGEEGQAIMTLPRGFYLRTQFTREVLQENYL